MGNQSAECGDWEILTFGFVRFEIFRETVIRRRQRRRDVADRGEPGGSFFRVLQGEQQQTHGLRQITLREPLRGERGEFRAQLGYGAAHDLFGRPL
tara:strand:+ start:993 stop:1280 length:288 start_codon:yes stop_codon:yes gene_type:complete